jgi:hypothetical protein
MPPDRPVVALTEIAAENRRDLKSSDWVVLEHLATAAIDGGEVETTSREIGRAVGLNKETASAALQRLIDAGLASRVELRDGPSGRFSRSRYAVDLSAAGFLSPRLCRDATNRHDSPTSTTSRGNVHPNQLSFLDL